MIRNKFEQVSKVVVIIPSPVLGLHGIGVSAKHLKYCKK